MKTILVIEDESIVQKFLNEFSDSEVYTINKKENLTKNNIPTINISKNLIYKNIVLNTENYEVFIDNKKVELTIREFDILRTLIENANKVFSRNELLDLVWGYDYYGDSNIVNTHIKNIRQKIGNQYITTVRGIGYKI